MARDGGYRFFQQDPCRLDSAEVVRGEFEVGDSASRQVLLIRYVLIRGDEQVKLALGTLEQLAILGASPTLILTFAQV